MDRRRRCRVCRVGLPDSTSIARHLAVEIWQPRLAAGSALQLPEHLQLSLVRIIVRIVLVIAISQQGYHAIV